MRRLLKAGIFVFAALLAGVIAGSIVPSLVVDEPDRGPTVASRDLPAGPKMPDVVGLSLDVANDVLDQRRIDHEHVGGGILGVVLPFNWEVCESEPAAGRPVHGTAFLRVEREGDC